jgi:glucosamine-6-phosphate deaminase
MIKEQQIDNLELRIFQNREKMGEAAATAVAERIIKLLIDQEFVNIIFASAPSQNEFLAALIRNKEIDWSRVNAFHMDEYIGLPKGHPALFSSFLQAKVFDHVSCHTVNYISGNAPDALAECSRYAELLTQYSPDIVCLGIGENGHIAFNDPHVADLNDPVKVKIIDLDFECKQQQVSDGCFPNLNSVPSLAITLTVPALMAGRYVFGIVPGANKARAIYRTLYNKISEQCPASVLRRHPQAILFLDTDSSSLLKS